MDVIELRRRLMMGMAQGAGFITGTISPTTAGTITVNFGKTLNDYIVFIEMTDQSLTALANYAPTAYKGFSFLGKRAWKDIDGHPISNKTLAQRYNTTYASFVNSTASTAITFNDDNFKINCSDVSANTPGNLYIGYSYNYIVIPI